jgi:hypothetical protein
LITTKLGIKICNLLNLIKDCLKKLYPSYGVLYKEDVRFKVVDTTDIELRSYIHPDYDYIKLHHGKYRFPRYTFTTKKLQKRCKDLYDPTKTIDELVKGLGFIKIFNAGYNLYSLN